MKPFRFWVQTALPLVYDDSLSYYELLCKVIDYINNFITTENQFAETIEEYTAKVDQIQQYVDGYFESSDFKQLVDDALDKMAEDGDFDSIITAILEAYEQQIDGTITEIQGDITSLEGDVGGLDTRLDTAEGNISDNATAIDNLDGKIDNEIDGVNDRIDDEVAELNAKIESGGAVWELVVVGGSQIGNCYFMYHDNEAVLFDTGNDPLGTNLIAALVSRGISKIKAIIVSHWHSDHIGGLEPVLNDARFDFTECVMYKPHGNINYSRCTGSWTEYIPGRDTDATALITAKGGTAVYATEGQSITIDSAEIVFNNLLATKFDNYYANYIDENLTNTGETQYNNFCMIVSVFLGNNKAVFPADLMPASEAQNRDVVVGANLYMVEHHGLNLETDYAYLNGINPDIALICNYGSYYGLAINCGYPTVNKCFACESLFDNSANDIEISMGYYGFAGRSDVNRGLAKSPYVGDLSVGRELVAGTDFNNLNVPGIYSVRNTTMLGNMLNAPTANSGGKLIVMCDTTSGAMTQVFVCANSVTPMVAIRNLGVGDSSGWKAWKYIRPSAYMNEALTNYISAKVELTGTAYQNRVFIQNGCLTISFYLNTIDNIDGGEAFITVPVALASGYYTPFITLDSAKTIYRGVCGGYNNTVMVWSTDDIPTGKTISGHVTFNISTDYPL